MARTIQVEGVFPLPLETLWKLLHAHLDDTKIRDIHPWILSGKTVQEGPPVQFRGLVFPREKIAERVIRIGARPRNTTWIYRIDPPTRYRYEIAFQNGSNTKFDNLYVAEEGGTRVTTTGKIDVKRVPSFAALWFTGRSLNRSDDEDLAYAKRMGWA